MRDRQYYSVRTGERATRHSDLDLVKRQFLALYGQYEEQGFFQEYFGYDCVDRGHVDGVLGSNISNAVLLNLKRDDLWPIRTMVFEYTEAELFDMTEFLFDCVSKPTKGDYHSYSDCGWHYTEFHQASGQDRFRNDVTKLLRDYRDGFEMSADGEILASVPSEFEKLFEAELPTDDPQNIHAKVSEATVRFRRYGASLADRRNSLRELADVLEFLRPKLKQALHSKDESDLFNIINNFGIRHHNKDQKTDYDQRIWLSWMFYFFLATIHAALRMIEKSKSDAND